jgi:hypothetical protein
LVYYTENAAYIGRHLISNWWSCGELHSGPNGNWLFVYKHSLS